jgi:hypothetical protein
MKFETTQVSSFSPNKTQLYKTTTIALMFKVCFFDLGLICIFRHFEMVSPSLGHFLKRGIRCRDCVSCKDCGEIALTYSLSRLDA